MTYEQAMKIMMELKEKGYHVNDITKIIEFEIANLGYGCEKEIENLKLAVLNFIKDVEQIGEDVLDNLLEDINDD